MKATSRAAAVPCAAFLLALTAHLQVGAQPVSRPALVAPPAPAAPSQAGKAMLRISCDADSNNAEITINGAFGGDCPVDVSVPAGSIVLRVVKKVDAGHERIFTTEFRIVADSVKRVEVLLGPPQLNAAGRARQEEERRQAELARLQAEQQRLLTEEARRQAEQAAISDVERKAETGDVLAMLSMVDLVRPGMSSAQSAEIASRWLDKARQANRLYTQFTRAKTFNPGDRDMVDIAALLLKAGTVERVLNIEGAQQIAASVASDAYFATDANGTTESVEDMDMGTAGHMTTTSTCRASGRLVKLSNSMRSPGISGSNSTATAALGGRLVLESRGGSLFDTHVHTAVVLHKVYGQRYPLEPGQVFGVELSIENATLGRYGVTSLCSVSAGNALLCLDEMRFAKGGSNSMTYVRSHVLPASGCEGDRQGKWLGMTQ